MRLTGEDLNNGMRDALRKVTGVVGGVVDKAKVAIVGDDSDEGKKKLLGSGMAKNAADLITKRKKDIDVTMGD